MNLLRWDQKTKQNKTKPKRKEKKRREKEIRSFVFVCVCENYKRLSSGITQHQFDCAFYGINASDSECWMTRLKAEIWKKSNTQHDL